MTASIPRFYYIPIILVGLWNYKKAVYVALLFGFIQIFLGLFLMEVSHVDISMTDQYIRAAMYLLVAAVVGTLSEHQAGLLGKVKDSEEKYRFIATSIDEGIIAIDLEGRVTYANPRTYEITGFSPGESMGKPMNEVLTPSTRQEIEKLFKEVLAGGKAIEREIVIDTKTGDRIAVEINTSAISNSESKITGVVATFRDVTERKAASEEIEHRNRELWLLNSISSSINSSPDIQGMLYSVLTDATDLLQVQSGAIYLADNARPGQMSLQAARPYADIRDTGIVQADVHPGRQGEHRQGLCDE